MAALARATADDGPGPLEGVHPGALVDGVRSALQSGLVDDLDWLAPPAAGSALYELASALPLGPAARVGRRVLARVLAADAATFVAVARRMALGQIKGSPAQDFGCGLRSSPSFPSDSAWPTDLSRSLSCRAGTLLANGSQCRPPDASVAALGGKAPRTSGARGGRCAAYGDDHNFRVFKSDAVSAAWERLLGDRESLVWRHVAVGAANTPIVERVSMFDSIYCHSTALAASDLYMCLYSTRASLYYSSDRCGYTVKLAE